MSKITFRADDELVERIEGRDASKSEIMREALREYLDDSDASRGSANVESANPDRPRDATSTRGRDAGVDSGRDERRSADSLDAVLAERVDELVAERLAAWETRAGEREREQGRAQDVNVNVTLESDAPVRPTADSDAGRDRASDGTTPTRTAADQSAESSPTNESETSCGQCGESLSDDHVYCPNCGEKASHRVFCECGDEVRSDWGFCPSCGRRTPAADVLDQA